MKVNPLYYIPFQAQELYYGGIKERKKCRRIGVNLMGMPFPEGDSVAEGIRRKFERYLKAAFAFSFIALGAACVFGISPVFGAFSEKCADIMCCITMVCAAIVFPETCLVMHLQKKIVLHFLETYRPVCGRDEDAEPFIQYGDLLLSTERNGYIFNHADDDDDEDFHTDDTFICVCCSEIFPYQNVTEINTEGTALCPFCKKAGVALRTPAPDFDRKAAEYARIANGQND